MIVEADRNTVQIVEDRGNLRQPLQTADWRTVGMRAERERAPGKGRFATPNYYTEALLDFLTGHDAYDYADAVARAAASAGVDPRLLMAILDHESSGRQLFSAAFTAGEPGIAALQLRGFLASDDERPGRTRSIGVGQMQLGAFVESVQHRAHVEGKGSVAARDAAQAWPLIATNDEFAIEAMAWHLASLQSELPADSRRNRSGLPARDLVAYGYNTGAEQLQRALNHGTLSVAQGASYVETIRGNFERADRFYCGGGSFRCEPVS